MDDHNSGSSSAHDRPHAVAAIIAAIRATATYSLCDFHAADVGPTGKMNRRESKRWDIQINIEATNFNVCANTQIESFSKIDWSSAAPQAKRVNTAASSHAVRISYAYRILPPVFTMLPSMSSTSHVDSFSAWHYQTSGRGTQRYVHLAQVHSSAPLTRFRYSSKN